MTKALNASSEDARETVFCPQGREPYARELKVFGRIPVTQPSDAEGRVELELGAPSAAHWVSRSIEAWCDCRSEAYNVGALDHYRGRRLLTGE